MLVENITLEQGEGVLEVRGSGFDSVLLVRHQATVFDWADCEGSVGRYFARGASFEHAACVRQIEYVVRGGFDPAQPIYTQIYPLLMLFAAGRYQLRYHTGQEIKDWDVLPFDEEELPRGQVSSFYPWGYTLLATQPVQLSSERQIETYIQQIQRGARPIILTTTVDNGWCDFILDGHHKAEAYRRAKTAPSLIRIVRLDAPAITLEEGLAYLGAARLPSTRPGGDHYQQVKRKYGGLPERPDDAQGRG